MDWLATMVTWLLQIAAILVVGFVQVVNTRVAPVIILSTQSTPHLTPVKATLISIVPTLTVFLAVIPINIAALAFFNIPLPTPIVEMLQMTDCVSGDMPLGGGTILEQALVFVALYMPMAVPLNSLIYSFKFAHWGSCRETSTFIPLG